MQSLDAPSQTQSLTPMQWQQVNDLYEDLSQIFQFYQGLTAAERRRKMRPSRHNLVFVQDSIDALQQVPEVVPAYLDKDRITEVAALFDQLRYLEQIHLQVGDALKDLRLVAGDEAFRNASLIYNGAKTAAKAGYPKVRPIYDRMRERFHLQSANQRKEMEAELGQDLASQACGATLEALTWKRRGLPGSDATIH